MYVCISVLLHAYTYLIYFGTETCTDDSTDLPENQMLDGDVACRSNEGLLCVLHICLCTMHVHMKTHLLDY